MMTFLRGIYLVGSVSFYLLSALGLELFMLLCRMKHSTRQSFRTRHGSRSARRFLKGFGFQIEVKGLPILRELQSNALFVSNHLSFWDPMIFAAQVAPVTFITSVEVRNTPVIGWIARVVGCVFVERRSRSQLNREVGAVSQELREGQSVVLFPEATTTNGSQILPFKRAFFRAAVDASKPVVPLCINYRSRDGQGVNALNRDDLFYYGDQNIVTQLMRVLRLRSVVVEVEILNPLHPLELSEELRSSTQPVIEQAPFAVETLLSNRSYEQIAKSYLPIF